MRLSGVLDTDVQNPTTISSYVKPFSAGETTLICCSVALGELIRLIRSGEKLRMQDVCEKCRLRDGGYEGWDSRSSRSSFRSPNMIPSTHSPWRRYAFLFTPSRTNP